MELVTVPESSGGNAMIGICYLVKEDADTVVKRIEELCKTQRYDEAFWEEALYNKDRMIVTARVVHSTDVVEINTYEQLREIDSDSNQLKTDAIQVICEALDARPEAVTDITVLKKGMTNRSFLFTCKGKKYIMRIPGEGTDQLINRRQEAVGMYSNYYMLIMYLVNIAGIIANGMVASFGNLYVEGNKEKSYKMLRVSMLLFSFYGTICGVCYICLIQDFIPIWVGKQYLMEYDLVFAVVAVFYLRMVTNTIWIYRSSMGLFKEVQYINIAAAVLNIILSIALEHRGGLAGIIIATAISRLPSVQDTIFQTML